MSLYGNPPVVVGGVSIAVAGGVPSVLGDSHSGMLVNQTVGAAPANGITDVGAGSFSISGAASRELGDPAQCYLMGQVRRDGTLGRSLTVTHTDDITKGALTWTAAGAAQDNIGFDLLLVQRALSGSDGVGTVMGNPYVLVGACTIAVVGGAPSILGSVANVGGNHSGILLNQLVGAGATFGITDEGAGDFTLRLGTNRVLEDDQSLIFVQPRGAAGAYYEVEHVSDTEKRFRCSDAGAAALDNITFDVLVFQKNLGGAATLSACNFRLVGGVTILVNAGTPSITNHTGILLTSTVGVGATFGLTDNGVGDFTLRLGANRALDANECIVWAQVRSSAHAIAVVEHVAGDVEKRIRVFDEVVGAFAAFDPAAGSGIGDTGAVDVLFFKRELS